jgi:sugar lactone lactonase YvrE
MQRVTRVLKAQPVCDGGALHGESPIWDAAARELVWVDIGPGRLHVFDPASGNDRVVSLGTPVGAVAPRSTGGYVVALEDGFALLDAFDSAPRLVARVEHQPGAAARMNDGKCDPHGNFWAGSMAYDCRPGHGALYRLDERCRLTKVLDDVTISNGLDWSYDGRSMFFIDSLASGSFEDAMSGSVPLGVDAFRLDPLSGKLDQRRRLFDILGDGDTPTGLAIPDGMTLDAEGFLWVAVHGAGQVRRYSLDGQLEAIVELPVACPTSVAFGGDGLDDLYITSMTPFGEPGPDPRTPTLMWEPKPLEGALFHCQPGVRGRRPGVFAG